MGSAFRSNPWLEVVNWPMLQNCNAPAPFALEMGKLVAENVAVGDEKCLLAPPYDGNPQWFEGFTSQPDKDLARSFRKSSHDAAGGTGGAPNGSPTRSVLGGDSFKKGKRGGPKEVSI